VVIVVLGAALAWYVNARRPTDVHPSVVDLPLQPAAVEEAPPPEYPIETAQVAAASEPEAPAAPEPLPALAESDAEMTTALVRLLGAGPVDSWLVTEQFINRVVATVDSLPSRQVAPLIMPVRPPGGKFLAAVEGDAIRIDPANTARYRPYVELADSLDTGRMVGLYARYYPLFQQAYESLGYPDAYFNDRLVQVIDHLLEAPQPESSPLLVKPEAVYLYADENLEALSAGQKLLIRIGPEHERVIRAKLEELRAALTRTPPGQG
jgi:hypothetical protein